MIKKIVLTCAILPSFFMSLLKGEEHLPKQDFFDLSSKIEEKSKQIDSNLLEKDGFYQHTLPEILGENFKPKGTYVSAFFTPFSNAHPFSNDPFISSLWELCTGSLSQLKVGQHETFAPFLAKTIIEKEYDDQVHFLVYLRDKIAWEKVQGQGFVFDSRPLTSNDFKFYVDVFKNTYVDLPKAVSLRKIYKDLVEIRVLSDQSFLVIWSKKGAKPHSLKHLTGRLKPLPKHIYEAWADGKKIDSEESPYLFAKHFINHWSKNRILSCGPWLFEKGEANQIELIRNENFPDQHLALFEKLIFVHKTSPVSAWQAFKNGELTSCYISPNQLKDFNQFLTSSAYQNQEKEKGKIQKLDYFLNHYYFIGWNQKSPLFKNVNVRKALSYAIDQEKLVQHFFKGKAKRLSGPFIPGSENYNPSVKLIGYDLEKAADLLDKEGWMLHEEGGVRRKESGKQTYELRFHLAFFQQNEEARSICEFISSSLKEIGVDCRLQGLNYPEFLNRYQNKNFDALYMAWSLGTPPLDPAATWHSSEAEKVGSSNLVGFEDQVVDELLNQLVFCHEKNQRIKLYHQIHKRIAELVPYTFLYVPMQFFVYRDKLKNVFIPKSSSMIAEATVEEPCMKIFYLGSE